MPLHINYMQNMYFSVWGSSTVFSLDVNKFFFYLSITSQVCRYFFAYYAVPIKGSRKKVPLLMAMLFFGLAISGGTLRLFCGFPKLRRQDGI